MRSTKFKNKTQKGITLVALIITIVLNCSFLAMVVLIGKYINLKK